MKILNIDVSNTSIASYTLDGAHNKVTLSFSGFPESWETKLVYATFIQDDLNPTLQVIDGSVAVPSEILANNTDFYVGLYSMTEGETQVEEPTTPVLVIVNTTESSEIDVEQLIKTIMKLSTITNNLAPVASSGDYNDLKNKPDVVSQEELEDLGSRLYAASLIPVTTVPSVLEANQKYNFGEIAKLSLTFPSAANDGDVIYLTFSSGETPTTLQIDITNTDDFELIPEANYLYEIFGSFNNGVWHLTYNEYSVHDQLKELVSFKVANTDKEASVEGVPLVMTNCKKYKRMTDLKIYGSGDGVGEKSRNIFSSSAPVSYEANAIYSINYDFDIGGSPSYTLNNRVSSGFGYIVLNLGSLSSFLNKRLCMSAIYEGDGNPTEWSRLVVMWSRGEYDHVTVYRGTEAHTGNTITSELYLSNSILPTYDDQGRTIDYTQCYVGIVLINSCEEDTGITFKDIQVEYDYISPFIPYGLYGVPIVMRGKNKCTPTTPLSLTNATYTNGVVKQSTADTLANPKFIIAASTSSGVVTLSNMAMPSTVGERYSMAFAVPEGTQYLLFGITGTKTTTTIRLQSVAAGDYVFSFKLLNKTQGSISWCDMQIEEGTAVTPYEPYFEPIRTPIFRSAPLKEGDVLDVDSTIELPKLTARTTIIEVDTSVAPSNITGTYIVS